MSGKKGGNQNADADILALWGLCGAAKDKTEEAEDLYVKMWRWRLAGSRVWQWVVHVVNLCRWSAVTVSRYR